MLCLRVCQRIKNTEIVWSVLKKENIEKRSSTHTQELKKCQHQQLKPDK